MYSREINPPALPISLPAHFPLFPSSIFYPPPPLSLSHSPFPFPFTNPSLLPSFSLLLLLLSLSLHHSKLIHSHPQLERKRHIGNDIVVIIFVDHDDDPEDAITSAMHFDPTCMKSHFNHIFALVTYDDRSDQYKLVIHSAISVPEFGPLIPPGGEFADHTTFRDFLLAKCETLLKFYAVYVCTEVRG